MVMELYYPEINFNYKVDIGKNEYVEYLWEKQTNKKYYWFNYFLDDKDKKLYSKLEKMWLFNELDEYEIRKEPEFNKFLLDRFFNKAYLEYERLAEEWDMEKEDIWDYWHNKIACQKKTDYILLDEEELEEVFLDNFMGLK